MFFFSPPWCATWCASTCAWVSRSAWWRGWRLPWCEHAAEGLRHGGTRWVKWVGLSTPGARGPSAVPRERCCGLLSRGSGGICPKRRRRRRLRPRKCWAWRETLQSCGGPESCREDRDRLCYFLIIFRIYFLNILHLHSPPFPYPWFKCDHS